MVLFCSRWCICLHFTKTLLLLILQSQNLPMTLFLTEHLSICICLWFWFYTFPVDLKKGFVCVMHNMSAAGGFLEPHLVELPPPSPSIPPIGLWCPHICLWTSINSIYTFVLIIQANYMFCFSNSRLMPVLVPKLAPWLNLNVWAH